MTLFFQIVSSKHLVILSALATYCLTSMLPKLVIYSEISKFPIESRAQLSLFRIFVAALLLSRLLLLAEMLMLRYLCRYRRFALKYPQTWNKI